MQQKIYLDEGTTSWPKSEATLRALVEAAQLWGSPSRGNSLLPDRKLAHARSVVADYLGIADSENIVFVPGATFGLNFVLKGFLKPGDKVLVSIAEHNSVLRPLAELEAQGVELVWMECDFAGRVQADWVEKYFAAGNSAQAIVCQQASNVTGIMQPVEELCSLGNRYNVAVIVDGSQAGGHLPINLEQMRPSAWICSGHKGFRGIKGVGVVYLREDFRPQPLITGGTGNGDENVPELICPESYEVGTEPLPAIVALGAALEYEEKTLGEIRAAELERIGMFMQGVEEVPDLSILGKANAEQRLPIISVMSKKFTPDELAFTLSKKYGIETRSGMHCAPLLHKHFGTYERGGAVRFSFSHLTTLEDLHITLRALKEIC